MGRSPAPGALLGLEVRGAHSPNELELDRMPARKSLAAAMGQYDGFGPDSQTRYWPRYTDTRPPYDGVLGQGPMVLIREF